MGTHWRAFYHSSGPRSCVADSSFVAGRVEFLLAWHRRDPQLGAAHFQISGLVMEA